MGNFATFGRIANMESRVAKDAERELIRATQELTPEERLNAFLTHCRLMMDLYEAGQKLRDPPARERA